MAASYIIITIILKKLSIRNSFFFVPQVSCMFPRFLVCSPSFLYIPQVSCMFPRFIVCSPSFLYVPQVSCIFPKFLVCSPGLLYVPQVSCMFPKFLVYSPSFLYVPQVSCTFPRFLVCSPSFLYVPQVSCMFPKFLVCSPSFLYVPQVSCMFPKFLVYSCVCTCMFSRCLHSLSVICKICVGCSQVGQRSPIQNTNYHSLACVYRYMFMILPLISVRIPQLKATTAVVQYDIYMYVCFGSQYQGTVLFHVQLARPRASGLKRSYISCLFVVYGFLCTLTYMYSPSPGVPL